MEGYRTITPTELHDRIELGKKFDLVDVREPIEFEIARIEGARLLPLSRFQEWADSLSRENETVVICHHGIRSAQVCQFLARAGFQNLYNLAGGIDRWSREVDPEIPVY
jgi:rhodanese-related sulfurtransferase